RVISSNDAVRIRVLGGDMLVLEAWCCDVAPQNAVSIHAVRGNAMDVVRRGPTKIYLVPRQRGDREPRRWVWCPMGIDVLMNDGARARCEQAGPWVSRSNRMSCDRERRNSKGGRSIRIQGCHAKHDRSVIERDHPGRFLSRR